VLGWEDKGEPRAMAMIQFTRNYTDRSNEYGFQFEFQCDKCGNGHMSPFIANKAGLATSFLKAAGSFFGGTLSRVAYAGDHVKDALRGGAWDEAYGEAVAEAKQHFKNCTRCGHWVCPQVCWNEARGLCEACAPDLQEEAAHIQAKVAVEQAWDKARQSDQVGGLDMKAPPVGGGLGVPALPGPRGGWEVLWRVRQAARARQGPLHRVRRGDEAPGALLLGLRNRAERVGPSTCAWGAASWPPPCRASWPRARSCSWPRARGGAARPPRACPCGRRTRRAARCP
jgi:hypothetical protein